MIIQLVKSRISFNEFFYVLLVHKRKEKKNCHLPPSPPSPGIHGIGAVTALEILALFSKQKYQPQIQSKVQNPWMGDDVNVTTSSRLEIYEALERFRDWWLSAKDSTCPVGSSARLNLLRKLKNIEIRGIFPNMAVCICFFLRDHDDHNHKELSRY